MQLESLDQILPGASKHKKPALLVGNGFSIAYNNKLFSYSALLGTMTLDDCVKRLFYGIPTEDVEYVARLLDDCANTLEHLACSALPIPVQPKTLRAHANTLKQQLADSLVSSHPIASVSVPESSRKRCADFLSQFGSVFTTNYDLLLYWVMATMSDTKLTTAGEWPLRDGFGWPDKSSRPLWPSMNTPRQNVYYLHGALHLFSDEYGAEKLKSKSANHLMLQITDRMKRGQIPLIVLEGKSEGKRRRIMENSYLSDCWNTLATVEEPIVTYGFSFHENDDHIAEAIVRSKTSRLYIGVHAEKIEASHREMAAALSERRRMLDIARQKFAFSRSRNAASGSGSKASSLAIKFFSTLNENPWRK
jgi:hypothetical protein